MPIQTPGPRAHLNPEQLLRYMPQVQQQRQELRLVEAAWDNLALLSSLSRLSSKASANNDLARARNDFAALSAEMMEGLATEALKNVLADLGSKAQMGIDIVVRNLFERSADIGFFATDAVLARYLSEPEDADRTAMEQHLRAYASKYTVYRNILLFDTQAQCQARLRYSDNTPDPTSPIDAAFLARVLARPTAYVQDYAVHGFCDPAQPTLVYAQSVPGPKGACGVLCLEFDLYDEAQSLFASILDDGQAGDAARAVLALVDEEGRVIASSDALQLPAGWHLPAASAAGSFTLQHMGRRYVAVVSDTTGFQGYTGLGWRGLALMPLDLAFDDAVQEEASALMQEAAGNADLLPGALRQIPQRSAAIQSALERSVWNGLLELNQVPSDGSEAQARDVIFAKTLLSEIGVTAQKTAQAFAMALHDLHRVVMASTLRDTQSRTALAMQILDRNLYERANDCRWWALTAQFAETLQAGTHNCALSTQALKAINALYTVYSCLVLFDRQGRVVAVSNDQYASQVGQVLDEPWVGSHTAPGQQPGLCGERAGAQPLLPGRAHLHLQRRRARPCVGRSAGAGRHCHRLGRHGADAVHPGRLRHGPLRRRHAALCGRPGPGGAQPGAAPCWQDRAAQRATERRADCRSAGLPARTGPFQKPRLPRIWRPKRVPAWPALPGAAPPVRPPSQGAQRGQRADLAPRRGPTRLRHRCSWPPSARAATGWAWTRRSSTWPHPTAKCWPRPACRPHSWAWCRFKTRSTRCWTCAAWWTTRPAT